MNHTGRGVDESAEERVRAVLDGLRTMAKPHGRASLVGASDAQAILDDAWSMLSHVLAEGSTPDAGEVLTRLEGGQCSVRGLVEIAPGLIGGGGLQRAIISRM